MSDSDCIHDGVECDPPCPCRCPECQGADVEVDACACLYTPEPCEGSAACKRGCEDCVAARDREYKAYRASVTRDYHEARRFTPPRVRR
jgi:hypothetical protein